MTRVRDEINGGTVEQARAVVRATCFPPHGDRAAR